MSCEHISGERFHRLEIASWKITPEAYHNPSFLKWIHDKVWPSGYVKPSDTHLKPVWQNKDSLAGYQDKRKAGDRRELFDQAIPCLCIAKRAL
jgi:hypothetical protein